STKALASLFSDRPSLFPDILQKFADVDDVYVLERLLAAGYGSLARFPERSKARQYAEVVWNYVFDRDQVPANLLLRDYARGIIEIAESLDELPEYVERSRTRPPYQSKRPRLTATEQQLQRMAERAGGKEILHSCGTMGDFHRYEVEPIIRKISKLPLNKS